MARFDIFNSNIAAAQPRRALLDRRTSHCKNCAVNIQLLVYLGERSFGLQRFYRFEAATPVLIGCVSLF